MKGKALVLGAVLLIGLAATPCFADSAVGSFFGTLSTAQPVGMGKGAFQAGVGVGDLTSFFGAFRYGFSEYTQGRLRLGMADDDGVDASIIFGADFMYQFWNVTPQTKNPIDMSFQGFLEYGDFDWFSVLEVGGAVVGSYPFKMSNGSVLSPYGRLNIRMEKYSADSESPGVDTDDTNLEFGLNGGCHWQITPTIGGFAEFQIGGNEGLFLGMDFLAM